MQILLTFLPIHPKIQHNREGGLPLLGKFKVKSAKYQVKSIVCRVADDDPVNDQSIEFTFRQPKVNDSGAIAKYVVPHPQYPSQDLHEILPEDQEDSGEVTQEGFSGKDVVLGRLKGYEILKGNYNLELKTETGGATPLQSSAASIRLIIEPN